MRTYKGYDTQSFNLAILRKTLFIRGRRGVRMPTEYWQNVLDEARRKKDRRLAWRNKPKKEKRAIRQYYRYQQLEPDDQAHMDSIKAQLKAG